MTESELDVIFAAEQTHAVEYHGKKVTLNQPRRIGKGDPGYGKKKFYVYVKNDRGNIVRVMFGDPNMEIKRDDPKRRNNYRSRHGCSTQDQSGRQTTGLVKCGKLKNPLLIIQAAD